MRSQRRLESLESSIHTLQVCKLLFIANIVLTFLYLGEPCDARGNFVPLEAPPPPLDPPPAHGDWFPYETRAEFEAADFLFTRAQMSAGNIDVLLNIWAATLAAHGDSPPFNKHADLYSTIDSTPLGDVAWESFTLTYDGDRPAANVPEWMDAEYPVWFRDPRELVKNILANPDMDGEVEYAPFQERDMDGNHRFQDLMSGNWAWNQAVSFLLSLSSFIPSSY